MNLSAIQALNNVAKELSMAERGITAAKVILTGFVVVFAVLILLIIIIKVYSSIVSGAQNRSKKKKEKTDKSAEAPQAVTPAPATVAPVQKTDGVSDEVIAVISAAVASMYGSPEKARIKSIKKSAGGRSAWANAGVIDNTRPF